MESNLQKSANTARMALRTNRSAGASALINFVIETAVDSKFMRESVKLTRQWNQTNNLDEKAKIQREMLAYVDKIIEGIEKEEGNDLAHRNETLSFLNRMKSRDIFRKPALKAKNLSHKYKRGDFRLNIEKLTLNMGEITGVVGENANGKTTLFKILVGEIKASEGREICYPELGSPDLDNIDWYEVKNKIAYVPQTLTAWHGTLEENLRYMAAIKGMTGEANDRAYEYIIQRLGLSAYMNLSWNELSGGFKLRFELARALIWRPSILVLDEPLANLDFRSQLTVLKDIRDMARSYRHPMAVIMSSQHLHEVEIIADKILFLDKGRDKYYGRTRDIGSSRTTNKYEILCDLTINELRHILSHDKIQQIYDTGLHYIITTDRNFDRHEFIRTLNNTGVSYEYFRDISRSIKYLFEESAEYGTL